MRGRQTAPGGAPRKGLLLHKQLVVTEESDTMYHKLPGAKKEKEQK